LSITYHWMIGSGVSVSGHCYLNSDTDAPSWHAKGIVLIIIRGLSSASG
jgi:hypothetical protein